MAMDRRRFTVLTGGALASLAFGSAFCEGTLFLAQDPAVSGRGRSLAAPQQRGKTALGIGDARRHSVHAFGDPHDSCR
jgi:hypothetical protein